MPVSSPFSALVSAFDQAGTAWADDLQKAKRAVEMSVAGTRGLLGVGYGGSVSRVPGDVDKAIVVWLRPGTPETSLPLRVKVGDGADGRSPRSIPVRVVRADPAAYLADQSNTHPESGLLAAESRLYAATGHLPYLKGPIAGEASHIVYGATPMRTWTNESPLRVHLLPASAHDSGPGGWTTVLPAEIPVGAPLAPGEYEVWLEEPDHPWSLQAERLRIAPDDPPGNLVLMPLHSGLRPRERKLTWRLEDGREAMLYADRDTLFWGFSPSKGQVKPVGTWMWTSEGVRARLRRDGDTGSTPPLRPMAPGLYGVTVDESGASVTLPETLYVSPQMPSAMLTLRREGNLDLGTLIYRWYAVHPQSGQEFELDLVDIGNGATWTYQPRKPHAWKPRTADTRRALAITTFGADAAPADGAAWLRGMNLGGFLIGG